MEKKLNRFLYWTPRILSIVFILFLALFSLDVFDSNLDFWGKMFELFMNNIPNLILLIVLIISWNYEIVGGIGFILAGLLYIFWVIMKRFGPDMWYGFFIIAGPAFLIGILFLMNWFKKKRLR